MMSVIKLFQKLKSNRILSSRLFEMESVDDIPEIKKPTFKPRLMTGIQPTGYPHIGNYFGAIKACLEFQERQTFDRLYISVVDLHSITVPQDPDILKKNIFNLTCSLLACGLDHPNTLVFQQSCVPQHTELSWILSCLTNLNKLDHLPQWKEKSKSRDLVPLGLYLYPILQAADILIYKATHVPVGDDQLKHLEFTRHLARLFNKTFNYIFPQPKSITGNNVRMKSLRDPLHKMSKSEKDSRGRIELHEGPDEIKEKLKKAVTDMGEGTMVGYDSVGRPGISNIVDIFAACTNSTPDRICCECAELNTVDFKERAAEAIIEYFKPIRVKIVQLKNEPQHVLSVLRKGNEIAIHTAMETISDVKKSFGLTL